MIAASFLARTGKQVLLQGAPGVSREEVVAACRAALATAKLRPEVRDPAEAERAWAARDAGEWLRQAELWKLSWREAETFADRVLTALVEAGGPKAAELRPLLVEAFFEGVRPSDGSGPVSAHWPPGASVGVRRAAILARAKTLMSSERLTRVTRLLSDEARVQALLKPTE